MQRKKEEKDRQRESRRQEKKETLKNRIGVD